MGSGVLRVVTGNSKLPNLHKPKVGKAASGPEHYHIGLLCFRVPDTLNFSQQVICPVSAMLAYLVVRGNQTGPLFKLREGRPLTRQRFVMAVKDALDAAGVEAGQYSGHSFRIGAATTAAARGLEDPTVRTLDRWKSLPYLEYI